MPVTTPDGPAFSPLLSQSAFLPGLALALAIGLLIGVERGWQLRDEEPGGRVAGVRTFALFGLLGGLVGLEAGGPLRYVMLAIVAGTCGAVLLGYAAGMRRDGNVSVTAALAAIVTLALGVLATTGHMALASVGAGAAVILLGTRRTLHRALEYVSEDDIKALLRLVLVVFVILPLLPDAAMGPFGALNPRRLWIVVVVTGVISFTGYALARWLGTHRGTLITAAIGALASSTAVTLDSARRIRETGASAVSEAAVAIASLEMLIRALVLVALLAPFLLTQFAMLIAPALAMAAISAGLLLYRSRSTSSSGNAREPKPPGFGLAFLFALTVALISLASAWTEAHFGGGSGALVIALGGTADIDAAIAAVGALRPGAVPAAALAPALAAPILFNTLFKLAILVAVAGRRAPWAAAALLATSAGLVVPILIVVG